MRPMGVLSSTGSSGGRSKITIPLAIVAILACGAVVAAWKFRTTLSLRQTTPLVQVLPIRKEITAVTRRSVQRLVEDRQPIKGGIVIMDIDTPGGRTDETLEITRLIREEFADVHTVAYVNRAAYGGGVFIALACKEIVVSPTALLGDAVPTIIRPGGLATSLPAADRAKIESVLLSEMRNSSDRNGYDPDLLKGMVIPNMVLWQVRDRKSGKLRIVEAANWVGKVAGDPAGPTGPGVTDELDWEYVKTVAGGSGGVVLTADEAVAYGLATRKVVSLEVLRKECEASSGR